MGILELLFFWSPVREADHNKNAVRKASCLLLFFPVPDCPLLVLQYSDCEFKSAFMTSIYKLSLLNFFPCSSITLCSFCSFLLYAVNNSTCSDCQAADFFKGQISLKFPCANSFQVTIYQSIPEPIFSPISYFPFSI